MNHLIKKRIDELFLATIPDDFKDGYDIKRDPEEGYIYWLLMHVLEWCVEKGYDPKQVCVELWQAWEQARETS